MLAAYGRTHVSQNHFDETISSYLDALRTAPDNPFPHHGLRRAYQNKGIRREALVEEGIWYAMSTGEEIATALQSAIVERGPEEVWLLIGEASAARAEASQISPAPIAEF